MHDTLLIIAVVLMLPGLAALFVPVIPAVPYLFIVALGFGLVDRFQHQTGRELVFLGLIALASFAVSHLSGIIGARAGGAASRSLWYGLIGSLVGLLVLPPFGSIVGLFVGVLIGELLAGKSDRKAVKAAAASTAGSVIGMAINILLATLFVILFIFFALT